MRVAVMAAGAVGGYFGGRMAAAGHDVVFVARGAHGDAVRRDGLKIESALGDLRLKNVDVTDDPKQVGPVDVVLFAVKLWDTETAGAVLAGLSFIPAEPPEPMPALLMRMSSRSLSWRKMSAKRRTSASEEKSAGKKAAEPRLAARMSLSNCSPRVRSRPWIRTRAP